MGRQLEALMSGFDLLDKLVLGLKLTVHVQIRI